MNDIFNFFRDLFTTDLWPARWHCGKWTDFHGWLYIGSDLAIWFSYFAIPMIIIGYTTKKKYELKYTSTYILFASFILLCGSTHLLDAAMFWTPMYHFNALVRFATGVVSLFTVYHLIQILPDAFRQKTSLVLEKEIAKRIEAETKLAQANEGLQAFAYMASHDLKEPLRKINMFTSNLYEINRDKLDDQSIKWAEKTMEAAARMQNLIRDVMNFTSISGAIDLKPTDLNGVISQAKNDLEVKINERHAVITSEQLPTVLGDHDSLVHVFSNLISNAIKFSDTTPLISISAITKNNRVYVTFTDNGIGMEQQDTKRIFTPFERLHQKNRFEGSGIGLAIVKRIVDMHDGDIEVSSKPGAGTTFTLALNTSKS